MVEMPNKTKLLVKEKLAGLRDGKRPRVLDLFGGCGGISLGCQLAGAEIVGAVEIDPHAIRTHALNFHAGLDQGQLEVHAKPRDITRVDPRELISEIAPEQEPGRAVDIIVGGPPCQAFARVGRAKLREIMQHPEAFLKDPRASLYN